MKIHVELLTSEAFIKRITRQFSKDIYKDIYIYRYIRQIWEDFRNFIFENWSHFLDDCEKENKINPNDLLSILNSINKSIQFIIEYSKEAILDGYLLQTNRHS